MSNKDGNGNTADRSDEHIELIVRRVIAQELTEHRNYIGNLSKFTAIAVFSVLAILAASLTFWYGNRLAEVQEEMVPKAQREFDRVVDVAITELQYKVDDVAEEFRSTTKQQIALAVSNISIRELLEREFAAQIRDSFVQSIVNDPNLLSTFNQDTTARIDALEASATRLPAWLDPFSIWNSDDPIRILKDFAWKVSSDNFYSDIGAYYLNISHDNVLDGKQIIVSRIFELDRLKGEPDQGRSKIQQISQRCSCPIIFLDESYYNLSVNRRSLVGGTIYFADNTASMYEPLSEWHNQLPGVLSGIKRGRL